MDWYLGVLKKYADFSGRARRTEWWMFSLFNLVIAVGLRIVEAIVNGPGILSWLYTVAVVIPGLAVSVRRLHDTNRSGWWMLIGLVPFLGAVVLVIFFLQEGTRGENPYGPDPKAAPAPGAAPAGGA